MAWNPNNLVKAAEKADVTFEVDATWLDVDPYGKGFQPVGVVWHHTACNPLATGNMPSLNWCRNPGAFTGQARACHIVVGRDGKLQIIAGRGAYHAGAGGPLKVNGTAIPKDLGNRYLIGIEIEASSSTKINKTNRQTPKHGMNPAQFDAVAKFCAALFDNLNWDTEAAIRHRDWTTRKIDVGISLKEIRTAIDSHRKAAQVPVPKPPVAKPPTVTILKPQPPAISKPPVVSVLDVQIRKKNDSVALVQKALQKEVGLAKQVSPVFNAATKAAYKKWQQKLGFTGADADGIPGVKSLRALGKKHGFSVKAS